MTSLTFTILYHRTLKNKTSEWILIEVKDLLNDNRISDETRFSYENIKEGIIIHIDFVNTEQMEVYTELLKKRDLYLANTLMSNY